MAKSPDVKARSLKNTQGIDKNANGEVAIFLMCHKFKDGEVAKLNKYNKKSCVMAKSPDVKASSPNVHTQGDVATHIYQINTRKHIPDKHISDRAQLKHISDKHTRYIHIYI